MKRCRPIGKFIFLFFILALSGCGAADDNLLVTNTPIPTPNAIEDMPLYLYLQQHLGDLNAASSDPTPIPFSIAAGDLPTDIAARLERAGLIKSAETFVNLIKYKRIGTKIQAGDFVLRKNDDDERNRGSSAARLCQVDQADDFAGLARGGNRRLFCGDGLEEFQQESILAIGARR